MEVTWLARERERWRCRQGIEPVVPVLACLFVAAAFMDGWERGDIVAEPKLQRRQRRVRVVVKAADFAIEDLPAEGVADQQVEAQEKGGFTHRAGGRRPS